MDKTKKKYDPRPDHTEDSNLWDMVLQVAEKIDKETFWVLHGFRCFGTKLIYDMNHPKFKLQMKPRFGKHEWKNVEEWNQNRQEWLIPHMENIILVFNTVAKFLDQTYQKRISS